MTRPAAVAVITRTKNRTVLLKRAIESVLAQSHRDWRMVIVNDGGDPAPVERLAERFAARSEGRIRIVHNAASLGMHGASAAGFEHIEGDLVAVHDDDDSWAPEFLAVSVATLQRVQADFPSVRGVTTYCKPHRRARARQRRQHRQRRTVHRRGPGRAAEPRTACWRTTSCRRSRSCSNARLSDALGGLYEPMPYLGDWDFLIRFLMRFDIYMIPQHLAFYHWRVDTDGDFGNSIIAELERHRFYRQLLLNRWLREDLSSGRFGIGAYANLRGQLQKLLEKEPGRPR